MNEDLKKAASQVFADHPQVNQVIVCSDGSCFLPEARSLAVDHARRHGHKYYTIERTAQVEQTNFPVTAKSTVGEVSQWAAEETDIALLQTVLETVTTKGARKAIEERIAILNTTQP